MNERIKELLKQSCGFEYDEDGNELTPILVGKDLAKFAELIVAECIAQCKKNKDHEWLGAGSKLSAFNIAEHFGVEL
jgi:hypothetical protein